MDQVTSRRLAGRVRMIIMLSFFYPVKFIATAVSYFALTWHDIRCSDISPAWKCLKREKWVQVSTFLGPAYLGTFYLNNAPFKGPKL